MTTFTDAPTVDAWTKLGAWTWAAIDGRPPRVGIPPADDSVVSLRVVPDEHYSSYAGAAQALSMVTETARRNGRPLPESGVRAAALLERQDPDAGRGHASGADAITFAIVRRISRESLHTSRLVDDLARAMLDVNRRAWTGLPLVVWVPAVELLDRPSVRLLVRLHQLAETRDMLRIVTVHSRSSATLRAAPPESVPFLERIDLARAALLDKVGDLATADVEHASAARPDGAPSPGELPSAPVEECHRHMADALVNQNFEAVFLWAAAAAAQAADPGAHAQTLRLVALAEANLGQYDEALRQLAEARDHSEDPLFRAHLHYLSGLLHSKRFYALDAADEAYDAGLEQVEQATGLEGDGAGQGRAAVERAWLTNGKALVGTLRARAADDAAERERRLDECLRMELDALGTLAHGRRPDEVYLKFNLLANITFLLEIRGEIRQAIDFWGRAFGQFLEVGDTVSFEKTYRYRLGVLRAKACDVEGAIAALGRCADLATAEGDRFSLERVLPALAFTHYRSGRLTEAGRQLRRGLDVATENRNDSQAAECLTGLGRLAAEQGDHTGLQDSLARLRDLGALQDPDLSDDRAPEELRDAVLRRLRFPTPPPKLPAYIPVVDLEPVPDEDLNRYLADAHEGS